MSQWHQLLDVVLTTIRARMAERTRAGLWYVVHMRQLGSTEGIERVDFRAFEADRDRFWEDFLNGNAEQFGEP